MNKRTIKLLICCCLIVLIILRVWPVWDISSTISNITGKDQNQKQAFEVLALEQMSISALKTNRKNLNIPIFSIKFYRSFWTVLLLTIAVSRRYLEYYKIVTDVRKRIINLLNIYFQGSKYKENCLTF